MDAARMPPGPAYLQALSTWLVRTRLEDMPPEIVERGALDHGRLHCRGRCGPARTRDAGFYREASGRRRTR